MNMSTKYIRIVPALAAMALLPLSCSRIDGQEGAIGEEPSSSEVIRYDVAGTVVEGVKSSLDGCKELGEITLTSADGSYSLTLTGSAAPTSDGLEQCAEEATKAAPVTSTNIESRYDGGLIQILALKEVTATEYIPQQDLIFASRVSGSETSTWKTATDYIWPAEALNFWSWAPYSETAVAGKLSDAAVSGGNLTFSYECPSIGTDGKVAEAQNDVLLAYTKHSSSDKGNVSLIYKHALSAVCFKVDMANKCTIKSVSLSNVYSKGSCSFDGSSISWSGQSEPKEFTETFNTPIDEYLKDDYANPQGLSTEEGAGDVNKTFLFVPQSATDEKKVTITLVVRLDGYSEDLTLSAEISPIDALWEPGWTYTYVLSNLEGSLEVSVDDVVEGNVKQDVKIMSTKNSTVKCFIRALIIGNWHQNLGTSSEPIPGTIMAPWSLTDGTFSPALPATAGTAVNNWILGADGFYYYKYPVYPDTETGTGADGEGDADKLFTSYTAPVDAPVNGSYLNLSIVVQGVKWDMDKVLVRKAWGSTAAGYLSATDKGSSN